MPQLPSWTDASSDALTAALTAVTDANTKQELAFTKQIDQIATLIKSAADTQDARTKAVEGRLDRGEGGTQAEDKSGARQLVLAALVFSALSAFSAVAGIVFAVVAVATHGKF